MARTEALWGNESCPMISTETDDAGRKQNIQHQGMLGCSNITCTMNRSEASLYRFKGRMKRLIKFFLKSDCFDAWSGDELLCGNQCVYFREVKRADGSRIGGQWVTGAEKENRAEQGDGVRWPLGGASGWPLR